MKSPNFFIVGAPKCGTTSLYGILAQHPDVFMPAFKEPHHYASDLWHPHAGEIYRKAATADGYSALFSPVVSECARGEASVFYLFSRKAASNIYSEHPEARILVMLRNPADYIYSMHNQTVINGDEPVESFEEAIRTSPEARMEMGLRPTNRFRFGFDYWSAARFVEQLERYYAVFPESQILVFLFDDLQADPSAVYRQTFEFLGVDPDFEPEPVYQNASRSLRHRWIMQLVWSDHPARKRLAGLIPLGPRMLMHEKLSRLGTRVQARPPLSEALRNEILERLGPQSKALEDRLGRKLPSGWFPSPVD